MKYPVTVKIYIRYDNWEKEPPYKEELITNSIDFSLLKQKYSSKEWILIYPDEPVKNNIFNMYAENSGNIIQGSRDFDLRPAIKPETQASTAHTARATKTFLSSVFKFMFKTVLGWIINIVCSIIAAYIIYKYRLF